MPDFTLPLSVQQERTRDAPRLYTKAHTPTRPAAFDWDAITPVCKGCGQKSGRLNDVSLCPSCRDDEPAPLTAADPEPGAPEARPSASDALPPGEWIQRGGVRVWQPVVGPDLPARKTPGSRPNTHGTKVDEAAVVAAYRAGATRAELAQEHGVLVARIRSILLRHNVELRDDRTTGSGGQNRRAYPPELIEKVRHLYLDEHLSRTQVGGRLGLTLKQVERLMGRHGITARTRQTGRADGARQLRERIAALGVPSRDIKAWAVQQGLLTEVARGLCPERIVAAYEAAHPQQEGAIAS